ncbi:hypothetical protein PGTUg99_018975 [Puccinia graminis f. sp. tritici]|uniref:Uncharacterized protein n=1 Tax=Puccinia graminis f. sp. tritici TaxID=56615 RepID=A0A5B0S5G1_PUCGR|nr:hypothetical protein PGTUg99_018975 [Puccinia graminis f. sp. tritici]
MLAEIEPTKSQTNSTTDYKSTGKRERTQSFTQSTSQRPEKQNSIYLLFKLLDPSTHPVHSHPPPGHEQEQTKQELTYITATDPTALLRAIFPIRPFHRIVLGPPYNQPTPKSISLLEPLNPILSIPHPSADPDQLDRQLIYCTFRVQLIIQPTLSDTSLGLFFSLKSTQSRFTAS